MIALAPDISGQIIATHYKSGDYVKKGDIIFQIDDRAARHAQGELEAERHGLLERMSLEELRLGQVDSKSAAKVSASLAEVRAARSSIAAAKSEVATLNDEYAREQELFTHGLISQSRLDNINNRRETAEQALKRSEAALAAARASAEGARIAKDDTFLIAQELKVMEASLAQLDARIKKQQVLIDKHTITSPIDGIIDEMFFDTGERALQGFRLALVHNPDRVWVKANIKETLIRFVERGSKVIITIDSAPNLELSGKVELIRGVTVAEMAMMPNPNSTGVFTKITQRIPVRIAFDESDEKLKSLNLRPGQMVQIKIVKPDD